MRSKLIRIKSRHFYPDVGNTTIYLFINNNDNNYNNINTNEDSISTGYLFDTLICHEGLKQKKTITTQTLKTCINYTCIGKQRALSPEIWHIPNIGSQTEPPTSINIYNFVFYV